MGDHVEADNRRVFITLPRVMDDEPISVAVDCVVMVCSNADENGPIAGTTAIYMPDGLAVAVNVPVQDVMAILNQTRQIDERNYMPAKTEKEVN